MQEAAAAAAAKAAGSGTTPAATAAANSTSGATRNAPQAQPPATTSPPATATAAAAIATPSPSVIELELLRNQLLVERAKTRRANEEAERLRLQLDFLQLGDNKHNSPHNNSNSSSNSSTSEAPSTPPPRIVPNSSSTPPAALSSVGAGATAAATITATGGYVASSNPIHIPMTVNVAPVAPLSVSMTDREVSTSAQKRQSSPTPPKRISNPAAAAAAAAAPVAVVSTSAAVPSASTAAISVKGVSGVGVSQPPANANSTPKTAVSVPMDVPVSSNPPVGGVIFSSMLSPLLSSTGSGSGPGANSSMTSRGASDTSELDGLIKNLYDAKISAPILPAINISSNLQGNATVRSPTGLTSSPVSKTGPGPTFTAGLITAAQLSASPSSQSSGPQPPLRNNSPLAANLSRQLALAATGVVASPQQQQQQLLAQPKPAPPTRTSPPQPPAGVPSQYLYQQGAAVVPLPSTFEVKKPVPSSALIGSQSQPYMQPLGSGNPAGPRLASNLGSIPVQMAGAGIGGAVARQRVPTQQPSQSEEVFLSSSGGVRVQHLPTGQVAFTGYPGLPGGPSFISQQPLPPLLSAHHMGLVNSGSALGSVGVVSVAPHMNGSQGGASGPIPVPIPIPQLRGEAAFPSGAVLQASSTQQSRKTPAASIPTSTTVK